MKGFIYDMTNNDWSCGYKGLQEKPRFYIGRTWHDGYQYAFHVGPFWICCTTPNI